MTNEDDKQAAEDILILKFFCPVQKTDIIDNFTLAFDFLIKNSADRNR